jgi:hypothetical protein
MLKSFLAQKGDEKFLREVGVSVVSSLFDEKACPLRGTNKRMRRDDAMKLDPNLINIRRVKAVVPFPDLNLLILD